MGNTCGVAGPGEDDDLDDAGASEAAGALHWVGLYLVSLTYGDDAEGGWWFDSGELVSDAALYEALGAFPAAFATHDAAEIHRTTMQRGLAGLNEGRRLKHSVLSTGVYEAHVMRAPALPRAFPEVRPHYA